MTLTDRNRKYLSFTAWLTVSVLWLLTRIYIWNSSGSYYSWSREICTILGLHRDSEWRRFTSVLCYLQGLPQAVLGYFLLVKFPGRTNRSRIVRCIICGTVMIFSLLAVPTIAKQVFPSYKTPLSPNSDSYIYVLYTTGILGIVLLAAALVAMLTKIRKPSRRELKDGAVRWGLVLVLSFLVAVAYGLILAIVGHFAPEAQRNVLRWFSPDANLVSGLISMGIMAPLAEELFFRGLFLTKLRRYSNNWIAVIITSLLFALWHRNLGQFFPTFCMGTVFAWVYLQTGKLRHAIALHSVSNYLTIQSLATRNDILPHMPVLYNLQNFLLELHPVTAVLILLLTVAAMVLLTAKILPSFCKKTNNK